MWRWEGGGGGQHRDVSAAIRHRKEVLDRDAPLRRSMAAESLAAKRDGSEGPNWQSMRGEQDRQGRAWQRTPGPARDISTPGGSQGVPSPLQGPAVTATVWAPCGPVGLLMAGRWGFAGVDVWGSA